MRLLLLSWLVSAALAACALPGQAKPDYRLGMCHGGDYPTMVEAGIGWSRHDLTWSSAEPEPGKFDWAWYDGVVERGEQAGLNILPILCYWPGYWGDGEEQPDQRSEFKDYGRFAFEAARHYAGRIDAFEAWNEPNLGGFWHGEPNPAHYVEMLREAYAGIKRANPDAIVIGGSIAAVGRLDWPYLEAIFALGAGRYMDALSLHPYRPMPEAGQPRTAYRVRELLATYGLADMPVWITEEGWSLPDDPRTPTDEAWHANYFARSTLISWALGNAVHIWYAWGGGYGLSRGDGLRPAYRACETLTDVIGARKPVGFLPLAWPDYGVIFADADSAVAALWRPFGKSTVTLGARGNGVKLLDQYGAPLPVRGSRVTVELTPSVTYVTGLGSNAIHRAAAQVYPREVSLAPGRSETVKIWVTSALPGARIADVAWRLPDGWSARPARFDKVAYDGTHQSMTGWRIRAGRNARLGRCVLRADCRIRVEGKTFAAPAVVTATVRPPLAWTYEAGSPIYSSCVTADVDRDGKTEIIGAGRWQDIFCLDGQGREKWRYHLAGAMNSNPAVADLDGDGKSEIVALPNDGGLLALSSAGELLWRADLDGRAEWGGPAIADLDGDGTPEIAVSGERFAACVSADGEVLWRHALGGNAGGQPAVGDVDSDGELEVAFPCDDGIIRCYEPDGSLRWVWRCGGAANSSPVIADLNGDGHMEVIFASADRSVTAVSGTDGGQVWRFPVRGALDATLAAGDVTGDGKPEIFAGDGMGGIYCIRSDGAELWTAGVAATTESAAAVADLDGDGSLEIVLGDTGGVVHCLDSRGDLLWQFDARDKVATTPLVADVNDDGSLELVVGGTDSRLYCFSLAAEMKDRRPWPGARGNAANTGALAR
ncbi:MAG: VCBS repeat-containing protein [Armatimonadota bacterium]|nr:MAG: VCBS repeat-containing protein [Armatimonadota bacterium]